MRPAARSWLWAYKTSRLARVGARTEGTPDETRSIDTEEGLELVTERGHFVAVHLEVEDA